jgi:hypothetical protein
MFAIAVGRTPLSARDASSRSICPGGPATLAISSRALLGSKHTRRVAKHSDVARPVDGTTTPGATSHNAVSRTLFCETEAKLDAYEEDSSVLIVAPALLSESELSQTFKPAQWRVTRLAEPIGSASLAPRRNPQFEGLSLWLQNF